MPAKIQNELPIEDSKGTRTGDEFAVDQRLVQVDEREIERRQRRKNNLIDPSQCCLSNAKTGSEHLMIVILGQRWVANLPTRTDRELEVS